MSRNGTATLNSELKVAPHVCPPEHQHGRKTTCYIQHKCRCSECIENQRALAAHRRKLHAYGRWDAFMPAEPVRAHVRYLQAHGMGPLTIAQVAGVGRSRVRALIYGREDYRNGGYGPRHGEVTQRVARDCAERILAVQPDLGLLGERALVRGNPTAWRLQALHAFGWSQSKLADRLGMERGNFGRLMTAKKVRPGTAIAVAELYDEISNVMPPRDEWRDKIAYSRSRKHAAEKGWALPMDWEAYDNDFDRNRPISRSAA